MRKILKYILISGLPIICILIAAYHFLSHDFMQSTHSELSPENALTLYQQAINNTLNTDDTRIIVTRSLTRTIGEETFNESSKKIISLDQSDAERRRCHIYEELSIASNTVILEDSYIDDLHFFSISGAKFYSEEDGEDIVKSIATSVTLTPSLYTVITGTESKETYQINFSEATKPEDMPAEGSVQLLTASGSSLLSKDGELLSCLYSTSYQVNNILYDIHYEAHFETASLEIAVPTDVDAYLHLTEPQSVKMLEQTVGYLLQAKSVSANYQEEIYFEALGDRRVKEIVLSSQETDSLHAKIVTEITSTNDSRLGWQAHSIKEEIFKDQQYTFSLNNGSFSSNPSIHADAMQQYLHNQLISTIMLPAFISSCTATATGSVLRLEFTGNAAFAEFLYQSAGQQLYQDSRLMDSNNSLIQTDRLICHLEIDTETGLPLSSGIHYYDNYKIEGLPYSFTYTATQEYQFPET